MESFCIFFILSIFLTMPVSSASSEHSFSAMRRIKNYLRTTMHGRRKPVQFISVAYLLTLRQYSLLHWKTENWNLSEANWNKTVFSCRILQISIIWSFLRVLIECSVNGFYSWIMINYDNTYNPSFWYKTTKYINVLNYVLQFRPGICTTQK